MLCGTFDVEERKRRVYKHKAEGHRVPLLYVLLQRSSAALSMSKTYELF